MSTHQPTRRQMLACAAGLASLAALPAGAAPAAQPMVQVWKDPSCGCCKDWIAHMQANGFATTVHEIGNAGARARLGLPRELGSCHTALVDGYVLEGHVPAQDVQRLLKQRPKALGLAVPGMPVGSPGMDGPVYGGRKDAYEVLLVKRGAKAEDVRTEVYARYS
ncbi:DUF411 domain-containing protein [Comamonas sp. NLF-1-9]|uniref:DUF411 domain-containing protein n=1 Tax=Comamonas sp. NLF-1-9 TaxID=2853163 RepID=UPI001C46C273|nr:DUF411 domain-containing protein [Comamonas sp. NLF-1-9]QXL84793.1 DUF411 domain-containing protein [Comamonas sp. NLF-1-9]